MHTAQGSGRSGFWSCPQQRPEKTSRVCSSPGTYSAHLGWAPPPAHGKFKAVALRCSSLPQESFPWLWWDDSFNHFNSFCCTLSHKELCLLQAHRVPRSCVYHCLHSSVFTLCQLLGCESSLRPKDSILFNCAFLPEHHPDILSVLFVNVTQHDYRAANEWRGDGASDNRWAYSPPEVQCTHALGLAAGEGSQRRGAGCGHGRPTAGAPALASICAAVGKGHRDSPCLALLPRCK